MDFVIILLELLRLQLVSQGLVLLIPLPPAMLLVQLGKAVVFGLELLDVRIPQFAQDLMVQLTHAQHLVDRMDPAQEQDQHQQLVSLIPQFAIKPQLHMPHMLNAKHGMQVASQMVLDV